MLRRSVFIVIMVTGLLLITVGVILAAHSDIVISEIMIDAVYETGNRGEWVEIYNKGTVAEDLTDWMLVDVSGVETDTIDASECPGSSCNLAAGGCWIVAGNPTYLQTEFDNYTSPLSPTVQTANTIFLNAQIGNGLTNNTDGLLLLDDNSTPVDCVSWDSTPQTFCFPLTYVSGGNGVDQTNNGGNGQSIANIQGVWYDHQPNASPYNCVNTANGGTPAAVRLLRFAVARRVPVLLGIGMVLLALVGLVITRRRT